MRKLLDPLVKDVLEQFQSPSVQEPLEEFVLRPLLQRILNLLYPYIFGGSTHSSCEDPSFLWA